MRVLIVTNLYPSEDRPAWGTFVCSQVESLSTVGVETELMIIEGWRSRRRYLSAFGELRRAIRSGRFDLIHAHHGFSGWVALSQRKLPVVVSFLGDDLFGDPGRDGVPDRPSRLYAWINRRIASRFAAVIVKSPEMATRLGLPGAHVIPNGVDMERFRPLDRSEALKTLGLNSGPARILFAADPSALVKRYEVAERAVEILKETRDCELHAIFGRPQTELVTWMNACDALVLSSWSEGSPNVVKEAMACNLPVVASDVGDVEALLSRGTGNHVIPLQRDRDPGRIRDGGRDADADTEDAAIEFAKALERAVDSGRSTSRSAMEDLSVEAIARSVRQVYERVLT